MLGPISKVYGHMALYTRKPIICAYRYTNNTDTENTELDNRTLINFTKLCAVIFNPDLSIYFTAYVSSYVQ